MALNARTFETTNGPGEEITLGTKRNWPQFLFMLFWFSGWTLVGLFAFGVLLTPDSDMETRIFLTAWLTAWAGGWLTVGYAIILQVRGRQILTLFPEGLKIQSKSLLGYGTWYYLKEDMHNLTNISDVVSDNFIVRSLLSRPALKFESQGRWVKFARGLNKEDALLLEHKLQDNYPSIIDAEPQNWGRNAAG